MTMPSEQRYRGFLAALRQNAKVFAAAKDDDDVRRNAGLAALRGVIIYLQEDREIMEGFLAAPLTFIERAVSDAGQGADVPALRPTKPPSGRPTGLTREAVQGALAFHVELLVMAAGVPARSAANFVATEARKHNVRCEDGSDITAQQMLKARNEINRRAATRGGRSLFTRLKRESASLFKGGPSAAKREHCEALVRGQIKALFLIAPENAPNRRRA